VLLRPPNFDRQRGGWLPPNQHHHCGVLQCSWRSFWALFPQKSQNCHHVRRAANHLNASSFDPAWAQCGVRECTAGRVGVGDTTRPPLRGVRFPTPKRQHCRDSRDSLGTVVSDTVVTVSLSAPPTIPCSEQLAHARTAGTIWIWNPRHPPVSPVSD